MIVVVAVALPSMVLMAPNAASIVSADVGGTLPGPARTAAGLFDHSGAHGCAIVDGDQLVCWGNNFLGQLGDGTETDRPLPTAVQQPATPAPVQVSVGVAHSCAVYDDGTARCWGSNGSGQLGRLPTDPRSTPGEAIDLPGPVASITAGSEHTCALLDDGSVWCWGGLLTATLLVGSNPGSRSLAEPVGPIDFGDQRTAIAVSAGERHTCAALDDGAVVCWGSNDVGQLGDGTGMPAGEPVAADLPVGVKARAVAAGDAHSCAVVDTVDDDGQLWCWGLDLFGQLGVGSPGGGSEDSPVQVVGLPGPVVSVAGGYNHTCALLADATMWCWGWDNGALGSGEPTFGPVALPSGPVPFPPNRSVVAIGLGFTNSCALADDATLRCWGENNTSQLGTGDTTSRFVPPDDPIALGGPVVPPQPSDPSDPPAPQPEVRLSLIGEESSAERPTRVYRETDGNLLVPFELFVVNAPTDAPVDLRVTATLDGEDVSYLTFPDQQPADGGGVTVSIAPGPPPRLVELELLVLGDDNPGPDVVYEIDAELVPPNGTAGTGVTIVVADDDRQNISLPPTVAVARGSDVVEIPVTLTWDTSLSETPVAYPLMVNFELTAGTATPGVDYVQPTFTSEFFDPSSPSTAAGEVVEIIEIELIDAPTDTDREFEVRLTQSDGGFITAADTTTVRIVVDEDPGGPGDPDSAADELRAGVSSMFAGGTAGPGSFGGWAEAFGVPAGAASVPFVPPALDEFFGLSDVLADLGVPEFVDGVTQDLEELVDEIETSTDCDVTNVLGGLGGRAEPDDGGIIEMRCERRVLDIAPGPDGLPFIPGGSGLLDQLLTNLSLDGAIDGRAELDVVLIAGVDVAGGFYLGGHTGVSLAVDLTADVTGDGVGLGSPSTSFEGVGVADLLLRARLDRDPAARVRLGELEALVPDDLATSIDGTVDAQLTVTTDPTRPGWGGDLIWDGNWTIETDDRPDGDGLESVSTSQVLDGTLELPGFRLRSSPEPTPAVVNVVGTQNIGRSGWDLVGGAEVDSSLEVDGYLVRTLTAEGFASETEFELDGVLELLLGDPDDPIEVLATIEVDADGWTAVATVDVPDIEIGRVVIEEPSVTVAVAHVVATDSTSADATVTADRAALEAEDPVDPPILEATGIVGVIDADGTITLAADSVSASIGGVLLLDASDVTIGTPDADGIVLRVGSAAGTIPSLDDLTVAVTDIVMDADGRFGAASVSVTQPGGIAQAIGLGGLVPVDLDEISLDFGARDDAGRFTDLTSFSIAAAGVVELDAFGGLPFDPVVQLGAAAPITTATPASQRRVSFSARVDSTAPLVVVPLDVGPITLGFENLEIAGVIVSGSISADGYVDGVLQPGLGGSASVTGGFDEITVGAVLSGSIVSDGVDATATFEAGVAVRDGVRLEGLSLVFAVSVRIVDGDLELDASLRSGSLDLVTIPLGDVITVQVTDAVLDLDPPPGEAALRIGGAPDVPASGASLVFGDGAGVFAGWGGRIGNLGLDRDFTPVLLEGFFADVAVPSAETFGLPDFVPLRIDSVGLSFGSLTPGDEVPSGGLPLTSELLGQLRLRVSGGLDGTAAFPISASVDGLEVDLDRFVTFDPAAPLDLDAFPISNLAGVSFGIEPQLDLGGLRVSGSLTFGEVTIATPGGPRPVLYGRITGDVDAAVLSAGADLVVSEFGPVLLRVTAPVGAPLGPTGFVLRSVTGAATFGDVAIPAPRDGHPEDLLGALAGLPTDVQINPATIAAAIGPAVVAGQATWDRGLALALEGDLTHVAAVGMMEGRVTLAATFGPPTPGRLTPGVQLVGRGELSVFGIPIANGFEGFEVSGTVAQAGLLIDLADPIAPRIDLAFESPVPGSPLALVFPATTTVAGQLRTDGVVIGLAAGLETFFTQVADGTVTASADLFDAAIVDLSARLDQQRSRPLARLVLDVDGDGAVSPAEATVVITDTVLVQRMRELFADPTTAVGAVAPVLGELGQVLADLADEGALDEAVETLFDVVRTAAVDALEEAADAFDPSFVFRGALQPVVLGLPIGEPTAAVEVAFDRRSFGFVLTGSMIEALKTGVGAATGTGPAAGQLIGLATLGATDRLTIGVQLPVPDLTAVLLDGGELGTFDPDDAGWAVVLGGAFEQFGMTAGASGFMVSAGNQSFVDSRVERRYESDPSVPPDPNRIQLTREQDYDTLVRLGGIVLDARLQVPRLITDPVAVLEQLPTLPDQPLEIADWFADAADVLGSTETPLRSTMFVPGLGDVLAAADEERDAALSAWADSISFTGVFEGTSQTTGGPPVARLLSVPIGEGRLLATTAGLEVTAEVPLLGVDGTFVLRTDERDGVRVPAAGLEVDLSVAQAVQALEELGLPLAFTPADDPLGFSVRGFTPGFDPTSADPLRRRGGIALGAVLDAPGFVTGAEVELVIDPIGTGAGPDFRATAQVDRIGPFADNEVRDASLLIVKEGTDVRIEVEGEATLGDTEVTVSGVLGPDLTGQLVAVAEGGTFGGIEFVSGGVALNLERDGNGQLVGSIGIGGEVALTGTPLAWLGSRSGRATVQAAGCVGTDGAAEIRLALAGFALDPSGSVRITGTGEPLPIDPAAPCVLPPNIGGLPDDAAAVVVRSQAGTTRVVIAGAVRFDVSDIPLLQVNGDLSTTGGGTLVVDFGTGGLPIGGIVLDGSAVLAITPSGSFTLDVTANTEIPAVRRSSGAAPARLDVSGRFTSAGDISLAVDATNVVVLGVPLSGSLRVDKIGSTLGLAVDARYDLWGSPFDVAGSLTIDGAGLSGALSLTTPGGPLRLGGWALGGNLDLAFTLSGAGNSVRVRLTNGRVTVPGVGTLIATADLSTTGAGSISLSAPSGLRLGGSSSPFVARGSFSLSFAAGVATLRATGAALDYRSGTTTVFSVAMPDVRLATNGSFDIATAGSTIGQAGGLRVVVPSARLTAGPGGSDIRLRLSAGQLRIPGLADGTSGRPVVQTRAVDLRTGPFRIVLVDAQTIDLGLIRLNGRLVLERTTSGVFRLEVAPTTAGPPRIDLGALGRIDLGSFFIASDGSFAVEAQVPRLGVANPAFEIRDASFVFRNQRGVIELSIDGGRLRLPSLAAPITLPRLSLRSGQSFERRVTVPAVDLGPFLRVSRSEYLLRIDRAGARFELVGGTPTVTTFAGSTSMTLQRLLIDSQGRFEGEVRGRLALFGARLATTTFQVRVRDGVAEIVIPSSQPATLGLGFVRFGASGFARSTGEFSFTGSASTSGEQLFGTIRWNGRVRVTVSHTGLRGSYSGFVAVGPLSGFATGTMSSTGRITGTLVVGGQRVGFAFDLAADPLGADTRPPTIDRPVDITVTTPQPFGSIPVSYPQPTARDGRDGVVPVICSPASGSLFAVGSTTTVTCRASDRSGNTSTRTFGVTVTRSATVSLSGSTLDAQAGGFASGSITTARLFSEPIELDSVLADSRGVARYEVRLPTGLSEGPHHVVVAGSSADGRSRLWIVPLVVESDGSIRRAVGAAVPEAAFPVFGGFVGVDPVRIVDSRSTRRVAAGTVLEVPIAGVGPVPSDADAVVVNVTAVRPATAGFATVYPCGTDVPTVSNLNFTAGQTVPNSVTTPLGTDGRLCVFTSADTDILVDLNGVYPSGSGFTGVDPVRIVDSRSTRRIAAGTVLEVPIAGVGPVPSDADAVVVNVTAVRPATAGFATVYPCGTDVPTVSNLNFTAGQTVPNSVTTPLGTDGRLCVFTSADTDILVDLNGVYPSGSGFTGVDPVRIVDSRSTRRIAAGTVLEVPIAGVGPVPSDADAVVVNVTAVRPATAGFATVYPCGTDVPTVSNLNFTAGQTVPNSVTTPLGTDGRLCVFTSADTDILVDLNGVHT
jgi:alpha-tubulin suppressor-like RCC1 family protein